MELEEIFPEKPTFTLSKTGKTYTLRLPNIEDSVHWQKQFGGEAGWKKIFQDMDPMSLSKIIYRLLEEKSEFQASIEDGYDDDGNQVKLKYTGPENLLRAMTSHVELVKAVGALTSAIGASNPDVKSYVESEIKKKRLEDKLAESLTGEKSLTPLQASTDGPSKSSGGSLLDNSMGASEP